MIENASLKELMPNLFILNSPFVHSKRSLIIDATGSVMIDTSVSLAETKMMIDKADELGQPIRRLILTDGHFDHSAGSQLLAEAERIAQRGVGEWMLSKHAQDYLELDPPEHPDLKMFTVTLPTFEIDGSAVLNLTHRLLRLFPTPGHSPTHMSVFLEPDGVIFAGDAVMTCFPPVIQDGESEDALESYREILEMDFNWLVPGHGPVLEAAEAREHIERCIQYLQELRIRISKFDDPGISFEEVEQSVKELPCLFPDDIEMVEEWHDKAVNKVWDERRGELMGGNFR
ncbi:MAG: MBL fold metallo-hydrolase [Anaerolineales bacterium]|nr:MBL fold metallo-hydrolase [Anaerolineales bacterium]